MVTQAEMRLFPWEERYAVHVAVIDEQHKQIFKEINTLIPLLDTKPNLATLEGVVDDLIDYVAKHFATEERFLRPHPDFAEHQAKHQAFAAQARDFDRQLFTLQPEEIAVNLFIFLGSWLRNHILSEDQAYFDYLRRNSLLPSQG